MGGAAPGRAPTGRPTFILNQSPPPLADRTSQRYEVQVLQVSPCVDTRSVAQADRVICAAEDQNHQPGQPVSSVLGPVDVPAKTLL